MVRRSGAGRTADLPLFQAWHIPSRHATCGRPWVLPIAGVNRWPLLLLSWLLSAAAGRTHNIDEVLDELGLNIGTGMRAQQWLLPVNPKSYRKVAKKLKKHYQQASPHLTRPAHHAAYSR